MSTGGWISLYRSLLDNWVWQDPRTGYAWVDLLLLANHEDVKAMRGDKVIVFKRGTVNRSISSLAKRWRCNRKTAAKYIKAFESDGMVTTTRTTEGTTITIVNYDVFQFQGQRNGQPNGQPYGQPDGQPYGHKQQLLTIKDNVNKGRSRGGTHKSFMQKRKEAWDNLPAEWYEGEEDNEVGLQDDNDGPEDSIYR